MSCNLWLSLLLQEVIAGRNIDQGETPHTDHNSSSDTLGIEGDKVPDVMQLIENSTNQVKSRMWG